MTISRRLARGDKRCLGNLACGHPTFAGLSRLCCCHRCDMGGNALSNLAIFDCQTSGQLIPRPCYAPSIRVHVQPFVGFIHGLAGLLERTRLTCMVRAWRCGIRLSKIGGRPFGPQSRSAAVTHRLPSVGLLFLANPFGHFRICQNRRGVSNKIFRKVRK